MSTRRVDDLIKALGCDGISSSQVSRICGDLGRSGGQFRRPLDGGPYPYAGLTQKVREGGRIVNVRGPLQDRRGAGWNCCWRRGGHHTRRHGGPWTLTRVRAPNRGGHHVRTIYQQLSPAVHGQLEKGGTTQGAVALLADAAGHPGLHVPSVPLQKLWSNNPQERQGDPAVLMWSASSPTVSARRLALAEA